MTAQQSQATTQKRAEQRRRGRARKNEKMRRAADSKFQDDKELRLRLKIALAKVRACRWLDIINSERTGV